MIDVVKFEADHLMKLLEQETTEYIKPHVTRANAEKLALETYALTCISQEDGRVLLCGGVAEYWPGRGEAWAIVAKHCKKEFVALHNATRRLFEVCPIRRIEAAVDVKLEQGHRWVKLLGFKLEAPLLKAYDINGNDVSLYARVR